MSEDMKIIRPKRTTPGHDIQLRKFGIVGTRHGVEEEHHFTANVAAVDTAAVGYTVSSQKHPDRAITGMLRVIRKMLVDNDGVSITWKPERYSPDAPDPADDINDADDADADAAGVELPWMEEEAPAYVPVEAVATEPGDDDAEAMFVGPDGEPYPYERIEEFTAFSAGSSIRRWAYLMEEDDDLTIQGDVMKGVFEHLVSGGAKRPTRRSS
jgi:hypothetical protein